MGVGAFVIRLSQIFFPFSVDMHECLRNLRTTLIKLLRSTGTIYPDGRGKSKQLFQRNLTHILLRMEKKHIYTLTIGRAPYLV